MSVGLSMTPVSDRRQTTSCFETNAGILTIQIEVRFTMRGLSGMNPKKNAVQESTMSLHWSQLAKILAIENGRYVPLFARALHDWKFYREVRPLLRKYILQSPACPYAAKM